MGWDITCTDTKCKEGTWAPDIVELIRKHRDKSGYLRCDCGKLGYVEKSFRRQEGGKHWSPFLRGIIPLGEPRNTYQPFVFLVSHSRKGRVDAVWFSYYKDLRKRGGRLKLGYGPGGPPVLSLGKVDTLVRELRSRGLMRS